jgi:hypothetical protein
LRDKWLPQPTTYQVQSPKTVLPDNAMVYTLIDPITNWWDGLLLNSIFCKEEEEVISWIPISKYGQSDFMVWKGTSMGEFSMRSAYHLENERQEVSLGYCSYTSRLNHLWNLIWGMKVNSARI